MADNANGRAFSPAEYNHAQWDQRGEYVSLTTTTAKTAAVYPAGTYLLTSDVDCFVESGPQASVEAIVPAANACSQPLWAKTYLLWQVTSADNGGLAGIVSAGSGKLYILKPKGKNS